MSFSRGLVGPKAYLNRERRIGKQVNIPALRVSSRALSHHGTLFVHMPTYPSVLQPRSAVMARSGPKRDGASARKLQLIPGARESDAWLKLVSVPRTDTGAPR
jgi:hypothetical protein